MCSDTVVAVGFVNIWQSLATYPLSEGVQKRPH